MNEFNIKVRWFRVESVEVFHLVKEYRFKKPVSVTIRGNLSPLFFLYNIIGQYTGNIKDVVIKAVDDVSFSVKRGEIFGILGPNGSGKTTLLSILAGLTFPTSGKANVEGLDVIEDHEKLPEVMMYIPGPSFAMFFSNYSFTVRENLVRYAEISKVRKERVDEVIALTDLNEWAERRIYELSTGILARLTFAYGLLKESKVYFMDEPFTGISPEVRSKLLMFIKEVLSRKENTTVLYATHRLDEANYLFDKVLILQNGKSIALDTPQELMKKLSLKEHIDLELKYELNHVPVLKEISKLDGIVAVQHNIDSTNEILKVKMTVENSRLVIPKIVDILKSTNDKLLYIKVTEPTLEDAYMTLSKKWEPPEEKPSLSGCGIVLGR
jgi:ABC-2 type transport system ATP-binding protein